MNDLNLEIEKKDNQIIELQKEIERLNNIEELYANLKLHIQISDGLLDSVPDGVIGLNEKGLIVIFNKKAEDLFGYSKSEMLGNRLDFLLPDNSYQNHSGNVSNFFKNPQSRQMGKSNNEFVGKRKDGSHFPILIGLNYYKSEVGMIALSSIKDISEIQASRDEISKLLFAIEQSPVSVVITNASGNIEYVNPKFSDLTGYSIREVIGQNPRVLKSGEKSDEDYKELWSNITKGGSWKGEFHNRKKNGELYWEAATISAVKNIHDEIISFIAVKEDITDKKKIEEEVKILMEELIAKNKLIEETNIKLEASIKEKDKFFSIIAHDLKSPISGFLGLSEVMSNNSYDMTIDEMREYSKLMFASAESLYKLLENLLTWSVLKRGLVSFSQDKTDLNQIVENNLHLIASRANLKEISLINNCSNEINVFSDASMLNGIFRNLISNSVKFTIRGGKITVDAKVIDGMVQISIQDTGIGMPKEMLPKLFLIGEKTSRKGTENESSTGLGLMLCKEYIEKHNGTIWAESEEGKGTTFYFTMPIYKQ
ncbi:MAG: PAS domain S-box protein [Candidatus Kapabacteria bacterium]|nr:PAS domain S-box protein [Candidatus Kapabacteria bacterium]